MNVLLAEAPGLTEFQGKGLENVDYFTSTPEKLAEKLDAYVKEYDEGKSDRPEHKDLLQSSYMTVNIRWKNM